MADQNQPPQAQTRIPIKKLNGVGNMNGATIKHVLEQISNWIYYFYDLSAGDRKVKGGFPVRGFTGDEFDLSTSQDLMNGIVPFEATQPYLFISDLVGFVEEIRTSLTSRGVGQNIGEQGTALDKLGNTFINLGVDTNGLEIEVADLEKLDRRENVELRNRFLQRIADMQYILKEVIQDDEQIQSVEEILEKKEESQSAGDGAAPIVAAVSVAEDQGTEGPEGGAEEVTTPEEIDPSQRQRQPQPPERRSDEQPQSSSLPDDSLRLTELSPEARMYVQSLSVITINQALQKYFPDNNITFDQLPLKVRQQLMDRSFAAVHNQLLSGKSGFELENLIKKTDARLRFANECAIDLLLDIQGVTTLANWLKEYQAQSNTPGQIAERDRQIAANEKMLLDADLKHRPDAEQMTGEQKPTAPILSSANADAVLNKAADLQAAQIERLLIGISDTQSLDRAMLLSFNDILGGGNEPRTKLFLTKNIIPVVEFFIQEGLPPEFLIDSERQISYSKFAQYFGNEFVDSKVFNQNKQVISEIIRSYWLRKRAIWARDIRREVALERMSAEEAMRLAADLQRNPQLLKQHLKQVHIFRQLNQVYGGETLVRAKNGEQVATDGTGAQIFTAYQMGNALTYAASIEAMLNADKSLVTSGLDWFKTFYQPQGLTITTQTNYALWLLPVSTSFVAIPGQEFNPYDTFGHYADWQLNGAGGGIVDKFGREAIKWGARAAIGAASGGASEAVFSQWEAMKAADPTGMLQSFEDEALNKVLEFIKKNWPWMLFAAILALLAQFLPLLLALGAVAALAMNFSKIKDFLSGLGGSKTGMLGDQAAQQAASSLTALEREALAAQQAQAAAAQATLVTQPLISPAMAIAGQAVIYTTVGSAAFIFIYYANLNSAFLTHFPFSESELINTVEKTSRFAEMRKSAKIIKGCPAPENNGTKCVNPLFPVTIEYTVEISPKEDFSIQITDITDTIKFRQNKEPWNNNPPPIPEQKVLDFAYFLPILDRLGALSAQGLEQSTADLIGASPSPPATIDGILNPTPPTIPPLSEQFIILKPNQKLVFNYTLDDLDANYHHTSIVNTIEVKFKYQNEIEVGVDTLKSAARVCLGECSEEMCWPATGPIWQLPFGDYSHSPPNAGGWGDSYDIGCQGCSAAAIYGQNVFARFDGQLCHTRCDNNQYGCRYILEFEYEGKTYYEDYAHFQEPMPELSVPGSCMTVQAGQFIAPMSNRGIGGVHLHFGLVSNKNGQWWSSRPPMSMTEQLTPPDDDGVWPAKIGSRVTTCYE